jgi:hypothetical protein
MASKVTIRMVYEGKGTEKDDIIRIYEDEEYEEMFRVLYTPSGAKKASQFFFTRSKVLDYISDLIISLEYDTDSCDWVQVDTVIHPSVMYHVSDLANSSIRHHLVNGAESAMRANVELVRK